MKKTTLNQIFNFKINLISVQHLLCLSIKRVVMLLIFSTSFINMSAQNGNTVTPTVIDVNKHISSLKVIEQNSPSSFSNAQNIENLVYKIQPSIYLNSGVVKKHGEKPTNLFTDVTSLNGIANTSLEKNNIEIVIIKINNSNDLNSKINLSLFSDFYKLKYIYIVSDVNTTELSIANMFLNYDEQYSIFYKIDKGE
jgi:hypothetical protein